MHDAGGHGLAFAGADAYNQDRGVGLEAGEGGRVSFGVTGQKGRGGRDENRLEARLAELDARAVGLAQGDAVQDELALLGIYPSRRALQRDLIREGLGGLRVCR